MKTHFMICLIQLFGFTAQTQPIFYYSITFTDSVPAEIQQLYVNYDLNGKKQVDTIPIDRLFYQAKKNIPYPTAATLTTNNQKIAPLQVFLANNNLQITINSNIQLKDGSGLQESFCNLIKNDNIRPQYFPLYATLNEKKDSIGLQQLSKIFDSLRLDDIQKARSFVDRYPRSYLSMFALVRYAGFEENLLQIEKTFYQLPHWAVNSADGIILAERIEGSKKASKGKPAPIFSQPDKTGIIFKLDQFKGKFILIDFWASWCGPCRKEHPALIKLQKQFNNKNLEVISISLDDSKSSWLAAIKADQLNWMQLSDLKGFRNTAALLYGVQTIPSNFLINPVGLIIAKNVSIPVLNSILEQYLQ